MIMKMNYRGSNLPGMSVCDKRGGNVVATSFKRYSGGSVEFYDFKKKKTVRLSAKHFDANYFIKLIEC